MSEGDISKFKKCVDDIESKTDEVTSDEDLHDLKRCIEACYKARDILEPMRASFVEHGLDQKVVGAVEAIYSEALDIIHRSLKIIKESEARKRECVDDKDTEQLAPESKKRKL
ncbi:hypothetical protein Hte_006334 [Hypoxylon texense]